jgi:hypothetical protein
VKPSAFLLALALIVAFIVACNKPPAAPAVARKNEPTIRATVVTIQTTIQPANKTYIHTIVIANNRARSTDEADQWRLFDFAQKQVTYVDDIAHTVRVQTFADAIASRRAAVARPVPDGLPRAQFAVTDAQKTLQGVPAKQSVIRLGAYQRELWIGSHPLIPRGLFAMLQASEPASSPLAGITRAADEALLEVQGFPLADHAELPYENKKLVVDNTVVKIEQRDVPATLLTVDSKYKEVKPAPVTSTNGRQ